MAYETKRNSILRSIRKKLKKEKSIKVVCSPEKKVTGLPQITISGIGISAAEAEKVIRKFIRAVLRSDAERIDKEFMKEV